MGGGKLSSSALVGFSFCSGLMVQNRVHLLCNGRAAFIRNGIKIGPQRLGLTRIREGHPITCCTLESLFFILRCPPRALHHVDALCIRMQSCFYTEGQSTPLCLNYGWSPEQTAQRICLENARVSGRCWPVFNRDHWEIHENTRSTRLSHHHCNYKPIWFKG